MGRPRKPSVMGASAAVQPRKKGEREFSNKTMSRDIRLAALASFNFMERMGYLNSVAKSNPAAYLNFIARCLIKEDGSDLGGATFVIQQINVSAGPVAGVLNSPLDSHVSPVRLIANGGEVIDAEPGDGHG
jgi:hypothetical protein